MAEISLIWYRISLIRYWKDTLNREYFKPLGGNICPEDTERSEKAQKGSRSRLTEAFT